MIADGWIDWAWNHESKDLNEWRFRLLRGKEELDLAILV